MRGRPLPPRSGGPGAPLDIEHRQAPGVVGRVISRPGAPGPVGASYVPPGGGAPAVLEDPDVYSPQGATDFNLTTTPNVTVTGPNTTATLASFQLPANKVGVLRDLEIGIIGITTATDVFFSILQGGSPVSGWARLVIPPRSAAFVSRSFFPDSTVVRFDEAQLIEITATVVDANAYDLSAIGHGWHYPAPLRAAFR